MVAIGVCWISLTLLYHSAFMICLELHHTHDSCMVVAVADPKDISFGQREGALWIYMKIWKNKGGIEKFWETWVGLPLSSSSHAVGSTNNKPLEKSNSMGTCLLDVFCCIVVTFSWNAAGYNDGMIGLVHLFWPLRLPTMLPLDEIYGLWFIIIPVLFLLLKLALLFYICYRS